jgi:hypothetical protein
MAWRMGDAETGSAFHRQGLGRNTAGPEYWDFLLLDRHRGSDIFRVLKSRGRDGVLDFLGVSLCIT